jgi:acetyl esterase/lipase
MRPEDYPPQEPFTEIGARYHAEVGRRGAGIEGAEFRYGDDPYQSLTVFRTQRATAPVLLFFHGGGWTNGYKEWMAFMAPSMTAAGIAFVSAGYRLAPKSVFPAGLMDAAAAVAWVHRHIAEHGGDPRRLFVGGHSAGGHYTALLAVRRDWQTASGLPRDVINGCLPVSGVYTFTEGSGLSARPRFLGPEGNASDRAASPLHNIQGKPPPFLMAHGSKDFPHLMRQAEEMERALATAGGKVTRIALEGCDHLSASYACGDAQGPWLPAAAKFMQKFENAGRKQQ